MCFSFVVYVIIIVSSVLGDLNVDLMINTYGSTGFLPGVGNPKFLTKSEMSGTWLKNGVANKIDAKVIAMAEMSGDFAGSNGIFREATAGCGEVLEKNHMSRFVCGAKIFGLGPSVFNVTQNVTELTVKRSVISCRIDGSILSGQFQDTYTLQSNNTVQMMQSWNEFGSNDAVKFVGSLIPFAASFVARVHADGVVDMHQYLADRIMGRCCQ